MDNEFLTLSIVFMILGLVGIVLFGSVFYNGSISPVMTQAGDGCYCPISSPEPSAGQGTSSIFFALGAIFFPMGLMKGGLPTFGKGPTKTAPLPGPGGKVVAPVQIASGGLLLFGVILVLIGVDALAIPGYLILKSIPLEIAGGAVAALGVIAALWGIKKPKTP